MYEETSSVTRRLINGKVREKTVRVREYDSMEEYERANGVHLNNVNMSELTAAIEEYIRNVSGVIW